MGRSYSSIFNYLTKGSKWKLVKDEDIVGDLLPEFERMWERYHEMLEKGIFVSIRKPDIAPTCMGRIYGIPYTRSVKM